MHFYTQSKILDDARVPADQVPVTMLVKCADSIGETLHITAVGTKTTTEEQPSKIRFSRNFWIYSTAIEPMSSGVALASRSNPSTTT